MAKEKELDEIKEIIVYKSAVPPQELKSLCDAAYKDFPTPLQRITSVIRTLKTYDHSLDNLKVTREEWNDLEENSVFKDIARRFNSKELKYKEEQRVKKKQNKKFID